MNTNIKPETNWEKERRNEILKERKKQNSHKMPSLKNVCLYNNLCHRSCIAILVLHIYLLYLINICNKHNWKNAKEILFYFLLSVAFVQICCVLFLTLFFYFVFRLQPLSARYLFIYSFSFSFERFVILALDLHDYILSFYYFIIRFYRILFYRWLFVLHLSMLSFAQINSKVNEKECNDYEVIALYYVQNSDTNEFIFILDPRFSNFLSFFTLIIFDYLL